jgi:hypothetical protein
MEKILSDAEGASIGSFMSAIGLGGDLEEIPKARRVFDRGNVYQKKPGEIGIFFTIPSWWRGFLFHILSGPEFRLYAYLCSQTDRFGIAIPTGTHAKADLDLKHNDSIYSPIGKLVKLGLYMKETRTPIRDSIRHRNMYQRPSIEYTLSTLLETDVLMSDLSPAIFNERQRIDYGRRHGKIVKDAIKKLIGDTAFGLYDTARGAVKKQYLLDGLNQKLASHRARTVTTPEIVEDKAIKMPTTAGVPKKTPATRSAKLGSVRNFKARKKAAQ